MKLGWAFYWPPKGKPYLITPDLKLVKLEVEDNVPVLAHDTVVGDGQVKHVLAAIRKKLMKSVRCEKQKLISGGAFSSNAKRHEREKRSTAKCASDCLTAIEEALDMEPMFDDRPNVSNQRTERIIKEI